MARLPSTPRRPPSSGPRSPATTRAISLLLAKRSSGVEPWRRRAIGRPSRSSTTRRTRPTSSRA
eukprot:15246080-Alexandrium_andersonii.AAC.1